MSFVKQGELIEILGTENTDSCIPAVSPEVLENFKKFANNLKKVAPKAEDFLYFSAVMMHAAEAAALNDDGTPRLTAKAEPVRVGWDKGGNTWKWLSNDPSIKPYKNSNGDIFPEEELVKAHKKWVHKPLCIDHKSSSVDHVRGFIVDTYYDRNLKRVIALCALDKAGYPQLARQVATGVSTSVSMGTAVGKAICTEAGCARVARTEADFCGHMKNKSGYGEINIDLNPLELSIVVNGADPKASIKHIIAAANTLNNYVESKAQQLAKLADLNFHASIQVSDPQGQEGLSNTSIDVKGSNIEEFKADLDQAMSRLAEIASSASKISEKDTNHTAYNQSSGALAMSEGAEAGGENSELAPPHERYAGVESISSLREVVAAVELKLSHMKQSLDKLTNASINKQEETMSGSNEINKKGYYQGTEEPTPGQAKYPKDPLNENLREKEDKQMVGEAPFPGVGSVDGLHPSPSSADPSDELERKKMLARAEAEERVLRREAIVQLAKEALENKRAYFNNGLPPNNPNTPTPNKVKYPKDPLNEKDRDEEDKQMNGQSPFPGVGKVDGLHPSPLSADQKDELKRKELLQRASLRAKFVKATDYSGKHSLGNSAWEVYRGDQLLVTATVSELSGGNTNMMYDSIATKEFGTSLIEKVKAYGADGVRTLIKKAQPAPAPAGGDPSSAPPPPDGGASAPPADGGASGGPPAEDTGKSGDPKENVVELAEKARDLVSDLVEGVRALTGEQAEMCDMGAPGGPAGGPAAPAPEMGAAASDNFSTSTLNTLRKELNGALTHAMKEAIAELNGHQQELEMISGMYDKGAVKPENSEFVGSIIEDAVGEAKSAIADGFKLMTAFVKYARGTKAIVKRAEIESELAALAEGESMSTEKDTNADSDLMDLIQDTNSDLDGLDGLTDEGHEGATESLDGLEGLEGLAMPADDNLAQLSLKPGETVPADAPKNVPVVVAASLTSKAGRAAMRAKLAADALGKEDDGQITDMSKQKFSDMLQEADHLADGQTQLDVKPSDSLGKVETLPEINKEMLDLAKAPPKVRKEAEVIHRLVSEGKLDPTDLDALVSEGLDKDAVAYYKKYFGEVDGGGEFASELVKEHVKAQMEAELNKFKIKLARSYELAYDMADRGLCHNDRVSVSNQVDEIMKFNDESFESLKKVVAKHSPTLSKSAGRVPQVGINDNNGGSNPPQTADDGNMYSQLTEIFAKSSKKGAF